MVDVDQVVVGILGESPKSEICFLTAGIEALQGAFIEHQVMFQKLSCKRRIVTVLVRGAEDLHACDALIIPGGGRIVFRFFTRASVNEDLRFKNRRPLHFWHAFQVCSSHCEPL